jgi:GMP synthase (glutamine-hydrolysing)
MRVHALIHAPFEGLGVIRNWLSEKNHFLQETHTYRGDLLPRIENFDWLIIMGGPQSLQELDKYPYLKDELRLITQALQGNKLILGICLGAQLIAEALGAKTVTSPETEIGVYPLQLTETGYTDPIMRHFPDPFNATHWHHDMPGLPDDATVLASSSGCPRQIIRFRRGVYGLQCHLELTQTDIGKMIDHDSQDLVAGRYTQTKYELLNHNYTEVNQLMFLFLNYFTQVKVDLELCEQ